MNETNIKLLGVITTFYPKIELLEKDILSIIDDVEELIIWNNTPGIALNIDLANYKTKIKYLGTGKNEGIGFALNKAVGYAIEKGFTHVISMDQDSYFEKGDFKKYIEIIRKSNYLNSAIYTTNYLLKTGLFYEKKDFLKIVDVAMTSGTVISIDIFRKIGLFSDELFIDMIDIEFSLRAKKKGINTLSVQNIVLIHGAGYQTEKKRFLWTYVTPNEYSPIRTYYINRNGVLVFKKYPFSKCFRKYFYRSVIERTIFVLLYENQKIGKIKAIYLGVFHGIIGRVGKQTIFEE